LLAGRLKALLSIFLYLYIHDKRLRPRYVSGAFARCAAPPEQLLRAHERRSAPAIAE